jgi:hypothetical protein
MSAELKTGGPAFPGALDRHHSEGMTLRDYFAAKALQGIIATNSHFVKDAEALASKAYEFADAMLELRK